MATRFIFFIFAYCCILKLFFFLNNKKATKICVLLFEIGGLFVTVINFDEFNSFKTPPLVVNRVDCCCVNEFKTDDEFLVNEGVVKLFLFVAVTTYFDIALSDYKS